LRRCSTTGRPTCGEEGDRTQLRIFPLSPDNHGWSVYRRAPTQRQRRKSSGCLAGIRFIPARSALSGGVRKGVPEQAALSAESGWFAGVAKTGPFVQEVFHLKEFALPPRHSRILRSLPPLR
jgi:hypothetical protein